jgi:peptide/nickel transport system permease protein
VHDVPVIQGVALYFTVMVIAVNLVTDIAYGWLDPRVRVS